MPRSTAAQRFVGYWKNWKWTGDAVKSIANIAIISIMVLFIGPETARKTFTITASAGVAVVCSFIVFIYLADRSRKEKLRRLQQFMLAFICVGVIYSLVYAFLTGVDLSGDRYVKGFVYTDSATLFNTLMTEKGEPKLTDDALVEHFENNPRKVWIPSTVDMSAFLAHSVWFVLIFSTTQLLSVAMLLLPDLSFANDSTQTAPDSSTKTSNTSVTSSEFPTPKPTE